MVEDRAAAFPVKVPKTMVGDVDDRLLVGRHFIFHEELIGIVQAVGDGDIQIPGISLLSVGRTIRETHMLAVDLGTFPHPAVKTRWPAMQTVLAVIDVECVFFAIQRERAFRDAVAIAPDH